jgi:predicted nuclease of predicted toxin-antitoxin system
MRFLVDAQLPRRIARRLGELGYDAIHTLDLPSANLTPDAAIIAIAESEDRIVVTKDADFVHSFLLHRRPPKLLLVSTGNISNSQLEALLLPAVPAIIDAFASASFVELSRASLIIHV